MLKRGGTSTRRKVHRQAVLAGGCGGWSAGVRVVVLVRTAVVVEWNNAIARCCKKNIDAAVLCLDLLHVDVVCQALSAHMPWHSIQISSLCTDFSTSEQCLEGERAFVTVTATIIVMRVGAPTLF